MLSCVGVILVYILCTVCVDFFAFEELFSVVLLSPLRLSVILWPKKSFYSLVESVQSWRY